MALIGSPGSQGLRLTVSVAAPTGRLYLGHFFSRTILPSPLNHQQRLVRYWRIFPLPMKILVRLIAAALFIVFFGFALKNTDEVVLHLFWNSEAHSPLILLLLAFLVAGTVMGVLAMTGTVLRYRRELARARKELEQLKAEAAVQAAARTQAPAPDTLIEQIGL